MLQLRPTFSESWYRVVSLKPRLRGTAQISRQFYRGERWYVVRDAASNQFHRLSDAAYRFVGLLDGSRTVGDAWELVGGQLADDAPTQPEVIQILSQLYAANLVETDIPPDATVLLRRHKKQMQRKLQGKLMNVLFPRIPVWDPDRFLCRWMPVMRILFSRLGAVIWVAVVVFALAMVGPEWKRLKEQAIEAINIRQSHDYTKILLGFLVFWVVKFIHECGHAFACRRFGGEVHEMGLMLLVFVPTPYVDASTAWAFPNKWARMFVGAAGMIVEIFVAALCAIAWVKVTPDSLTSNLLCYAMIIASFSTVVFNANPLLRYDGYYMLSDFLEIPNLQMRSREYLLGLIKRHIFRIKPTQPLPPLGQRILLFVYGLFSTVYRVFVGIMIILVVTWQVPIVGVLMALGGVVTWLVVPVVRLGKYLMLEPELHRKRGRAWAFTGAVATVVLLLVGVIPFPRSIYAAGVVEPKQKQVIRAKQPGRVVEIMAKDGQLLKKDEIILISRDWELEAEIEHDLADFDRTQAKLSSDQVQHPAMVPGDTIELAARRQQLEDAQRRKDDLTIRAPFDGYLVAPELINLNNRYLERGMEIANVATTESLLVKATILQQDGELAIRKKDKQVEVRLVGRADEVLNALSETVVVLPGTQPQIPAAVSTASGGPVQTDPRDQSNTKPMIQQFELQAVVANPNTVYMPGQGASVRLKLDSEPLYKRWVAKFFQLVRSHQQSSKWL